MKHYKFTLNLEYEYDAVDKDEAINYLVDDLRRDWIYYADEGELKESPKTAYKLKEATK